MQNREKVLLKNVIIIGVIVIAIARTHTFNPIFVDTKGGDFVKISTKTQDTTSLESKILSLMEEGGIPSLATAIIQNDNISWIGGFGEQPELNNTYQIASVTKTFTATGILQLYERGLLQLDDDINDYLPLSIRNPSYPDTPITFRMLLSHTSSLNSSQDNYWKFIFQDWLNYLASSNQSYLPYSWTGMIPENFPDRFLDNETISFDYWLNNYFNENGSLYTSNVWASYAPGSGFSYSNPGFEVLRYLLEQISNQTIEEYLQENIFSPLNMTNTGYGIANFEQETLIIPHSRADTIISAPPYDAYSYGSGALRSSVVDLAQFLAAHMNGGVHNGYRILQEETIELMHEKFVRCWDTWHYGLGWTHSPPNDPIQGHSGYTPGFASRMFFSRWEDYPNLSYGVILLVNTDQYQWAALNKIYSFFFEIASSITSGIFDPINVIIVRPNGGEILEGKEKIIWNITAPGLNWDPRFTLYYSSDNLTWQKIADVAQVSDLMIWEPWEFEWDTSDISEGWYWLKIKATSGNITVFDTSDNQFFIQGRMTTSLISNDTPFSLVSIFWCIIMGVLLRRIKRKE
ncbi:MAG: serine hydrolase domain-containing protein [Candidatus Hodarchaeota archaeon]